MLAVDQVRPSDCPARQQRVGFETCARATGAGLLDTAEIGSGPARTGASSTQDIMSEALDLVVETLESLETPPEIAPLIATIGQIYQLAHVSYFAPTIGYAPAIVHEITAPGENGDIFPSPETAHAFSNAGRHRFTPFDWSELSDHQPSVAVSSFTVPLATPDGGGAVFSVAARIDSATNFHRTRAMRPEMLRLAQFVHRHALSRAGYPPKRPCLAPLEVQALRALASTADRSSIASQLGLAETTVRVVIDSARHKLGALTTGHALALAVKNSLI